MKTLEINIIYSVNTNVTTENCSKFEYKLVIQYNRDNKSYNVFFGYEFCSGYENMIKFALQTVLKHIECGEADFSTIQYNVINFDFGY